MRGKDKREHQRVAVALEVTHRTDEQIATAQARNLGYGGMQVELADGGPRAGERLGLEFILPATKAHVLADAELVYRTNGIAGLRFVYIPETMRQDLDDYVSSRLAGNWFK